jgi:beta-glucanase (GH16 family)
MFVFFKNNKEMIKSTSYNFKVLSLFLVLVSLGFACEKTPDDPAVVLPKLTIEDFSMPEGDGNSVLQVRILLDKAATNNVVIRYSTKDLTAKGGIDYTGLSNETVTIVPGASETTIPVAIKGNEYFESDKQFEVVIFSALNADVIRNTAKVTLVNDDESTPGGLRVPSAGYSTPDVYPGYELAWADEFKGTTVNLNDWTFEIGNGQNGWGNNELQYYRAENTFVHNNEYLVIEARNEIFGGHQYTSSRMITKGKQEFKYGRIDIRAASPKTQGIWPALWMLGENFQQVGWPACGEIDILEILGHETNKAHGTVHWGPNSNQRQQKTASTFSGPEGDFHERFHVFTIIWEENKIEWFIDDVKFHTVTSADMNGFDYPFNNEFFFILNIAVGGLWPGNPDATTKFPQHLIVDYIRVFQK